VGADEGGVLRGQIMGNYVSHTHLLMLANLLAFPATAQDHTWTKEIDNSLVRVSRCRLAPHESVYAAEQAPALMVFLTDYSLRVSGAEPQQQLGGKPSEVLWLSGVRTRIGNLGDHLLEVAQVVPLFNPDPSAPMPTTNPRTVKFENDLMLVRRLRLPAGFRADEHRGPALVFQFAPAHIKFTYLDGRVEELRMNPRDIRFETGGAFTFENLGELLEVLRIELKTGKPNRN
jgi:hypothetical protein